MLMQKFSQKNVFDILYNKPYKTPEIKLSKETLKKYTGTYEVATPPLIMYITVEDGRLVAQASGQQKQSYWRKRKITFLQKKQTGHLSF